MNDQARSRVVGVLGSPRKLSATRPLLEEVLAGAQAAGAATDLVDLRGLGLRSCLHCGGCEKTGRCAVPDQWQDIYAKIRAAQHLVLASPIHFSGISGEMKCMLDRGQCFWVEKYRLKRPVSEMTSERRGLFVATCGGKDLRVFEWASHAVKAFYSSAGFSYWGELFETDTDQAPPMSERMNVRAKARELGWRMVEE
jgi:hypothetical protein